MWWYRLDRGKAISAIVVTSALISGMEPDKASRDFALLLISSNRSESAIVLPTYGAAGERQSKDRWERAEQEEQGKGHLKLEMGELITNVKSDKNSHKCDDTHTFLYNWENYFDHGRV